MKRTLFYFPLLAILFFNFGCINYKPPIANYSDNEIDKEDFVHLGLELLEGEFDVVLTEVGGPDNGLIRKGSFDIEKIDSTSPLESCNAYPINGVLVLNSNNLVYSNSSKAYIDTLQLTVHKSEQLTLDLSPDRMISAKQFPDGIVCSIRSQSGLIMSVESLNRIGFEGSWKYSTEPPTIRLKDGKEYPLPEGHFYATRNAKPE